MEKYKTINRGQFIKGHKRGMLGKHHSKESIEKIRIGNKGKKRSEETRQKISLAKKGEPSPTKGIKWSIESRQKLSKSKKGKVMSWEQKKAISQALLRRWDIIGRQRKKRYFHFCNNLRYKIWRKAVFERDNYTCQVCKGVGGYLIAHHIKSWAYYPELRYQINNGITLCESCHKLTPNYKGKAKKHSKN